MSLAATATTTAITVASAAAAVGTFFAYLYFVRRSDANAARDEAMALAETRREVIVDLRTRLGILERQHRDRTRAFETRVSSKRHSRRRKQKRVNRRTGFNGSMRPRSPTS